MSIFHGLSAFPITPADEHGRVDTDALTDLLVPILEANVGSVGLLGSTGTYAYLSRQERQRAVIAAAETIKGKLPLIVGVGVLRTSDAVALAEDAQAAGADALLLAPVSYTPLTQDEAFAHFRAVAAATDLPLCIYNNPGTTHFQFERSLIQRLADEPNIAAIKMPLPTTGSIPQELADLRKLLPSDFSIGYSGDWGCAEALLAGADTWYSVLGGTLPQIAQDLTRAAMSGDREATLKLDGKLAPMWNFFKEYGSLRVFYSIANQCGLTQAQPPKPILPLGQEAQERVVRTLSNLGVLPS